MDDVGALLGNMKCIPYDRLVLEVLSTLNIDWDKSYNSKEVLIAFKMFNIDHRMSVRDFNELSHFLVHSDAFQDVPDR